MHALNILFSRSFSELFSFNPFIVNFLYGALVATTTHDMVQLDLKSFKIIFFRDHHRQRSHPTGIKNEMQSKPSRKSKFFQNYRLPTISTFFAAAAVEKEMLLK